MTRTEIDGMMKSEDTWRLAGDAARRCFALEMVGRGYDLDALTDAWAWFLFGWDARTRILKNDDPAPILDS